MDLEYLSAGTTAVTIHLPIGIVTTCSFSRRRGSSSLLLLLLATPVDLGLSLALEGEGAQLDDGGNRRGCRGNSSTSTSSLLRGRGRDANSNKAGGDLIDLDQCKGRTDEGTDVRCRRRTGQMGHPVQPLLVLLGIAVLGLALLATIGSTVAAFHHVISIAIPVRVFGTGEDDGQHPPRLEGMVLPNPTRRGTATTTPLLLVATILAATAPAEMALEHGLPQTPLPDGPIGTARQDSPFGFLLRSTGVVIGGQNVVDAHVLHLGIVIVITVVII